MSRGRGLRASITSETEEGALRVVVEAKHCASLTLNGSTGILAELDRARDNRAPRPLPKQPRAEQPARVAHEHVVDAARRAVGGERKARLTRVRFRP